VAKDIEITDELMTKISDLIEEGHYPKTVAMHTGVSTHRFNRWMDEGNELMMRLESGVDCSDWSQEMWMMMNLAYNVNLAYANAEISYLNWAKDLARQGKSSWTMPFTWLERCRPGWQRREQMGVESSVDQELVNLDKQFKQFDKKRERRTG
jgi:hypothetical protein